MQEFITYCNIYSDNDTVEYNALLAQLDEVPNHYLEVWRYVCSFSFYVSLNQKILWLYVHLENTKSGDIFFHLFIRINRRSTLNHKTIKPYSMSLLHQWAPPDVISSVQDWSYKLKRKIIKDHNKRLPQYNYTLVTQITIMLDWHLHLVTTTICNTDQLISVHKMKRFTSEINKVREPVTHV